MEVAQELRLWTVRLSDRQPAPCLPPHSGRCIVDEAAAGVILQFAIEEGDFSGSLHYAGASLSCVKMKVAGVSVRRQKRGLFLMRVVP